MQVNAPGTTATHALLPGSDAIDMGDCSGGTITEDQRGVPRPQGVACDIGAFEFAAPETCDCNDSDAITGGPGADLLIGTQGDDIICGFEGKDTIRGLKGNDCIDGATERIRSLVVVATIPSMVAMASIRFLAAKERMSV